MDANNKLEEFHNVNRGYLYCEKCGGYYKLQEGEAPEDFDNCQCGGNLKYADSINEVIKAENVDSNSKVIKLWNNNNECMNCGSNSINSYTHSCIKCGFHI